MDLSTILTKVATDYGLLGAIAVVLGVALYFRDKNLSTLVFKCYDERILDQKAGQEIMASFTQVQKERQATLEALVGQIGQMSRALELASQANVATIAKVDRLVEVANEAKKSNNEMREVVAGMRRP
jgi:hypothetical protein